MASYTALFDACVLYPAPLRDLLLQLATTLLFRARWTAHIHDEWTRSLIAARFDRQLLDRTRKLMDAAVPDCLVTGYEPLIQTLDLPDPNDRHVLAAAIVAGADVIVTTNLRHFPVEKLAPYGIEPQHPDDFIVCQFDLAEEIVLAAVKKIRARLKNPPMTPESYLETLSRHRLPQTVERLRKAMDLI